MAKKTTSAAGETTPAKKSNGNGKDAAVASSGVASTTAVRNSAVPKVASAKREISHEQIAARAYEIYVSGSGGSEQENWSRAERELRGT